jgi:small subunit ribosomal protein S20
VANTKSAEKAFRQSEKRRVRNRHYRSTSRTMVKRVRTAVGAKDLPTAEAALLDAIKSLQKAASKGVIHRNQASRKIGRLTKALNTLRAPSAQS